MKKFIEAILDEHFDGKCLFREDENGFFVNCVIIGNSRFKKFADKFSLPYKYTGGDSYKILLNS